MEQLPHAPMDMPATYRIYVTGSLESSLTKRLWGMTSSPVEESGAAEQTVLLGEVADQAALVGIINALYNSGHAVISVERIQPVPNLGLDDAKKKA